MSSQGAVQPRVPRRSHPAAPAPSALREQLRAIESLGQQVQRAAMGEDWEAVDRLGRAQWQQCQTLPKLDPSRDAALIDILASASRGTLEALELARSAHANLGQAIAAARRGSGALNAYTDVQSS